MAIIVELIEYRCNKRYAINLNKIAVSCGKSTLGTGSQSALSGFLSSPSIICDRDFFGQHPSFWQCRQHGGFNKNHVGDKVEAVVKKAVKSFEHIAADIGNWCSSSTIHNWLTHHSDYHTYSQRPLPLLSEEQKRRHVEFSNKLYDRWGLDAATSEILWIHYDEKWIFGFAPRSNAKMRESLGLPKRLWYLYHKKHVDKVMCVAVTGYAFDDNVNEGGDGIKIGFYRTQGARIAKRDVRESRRDEGGNLRYDGDVIRRKGDV